MMKPLSAAVLASLLLAVACEQAPTDVMEPDGPAAFKKGGGGGGKPGDPPPPPIGDPAIVFSSSRDANTGGGPSKRGDLVMSIYRMDLTGAFERVFGDDLETQSWNKNPKWAPDGQRFVFHRDKYEISKGKISSEVFQIATARIDGVGGINVIRKVSRGSGHLDNARWSPVPIGVYERIVWVEDWSAIVVAGTDGSDPTTVATAGEGEKFRGFEWFSDGTRLIGQVLDQTTGAYFLRLYDVSCGSSSSTCTATKAWDLTDLGPIGPYDWFGDIAVARNHDWIVPSVCPGGRGPCDLWKIDLTAPAAPIVTRLTLTESNEGDVSWSPDPVDDDSKILLTARPIDSTRKAIILDLTLLVSLPWDGDLADPAVTVIADVGGSGGMDWAMSP
jgi:dipeptidyl aminopeptidase/acylaminoacyl peptidase